MTWPSRPSGARPSPSLDRRRVPDLRALRLRARGRGASTSPSTAPLACSAPPGPGSVELIERDALRALAPDLYESFRATIPGAIARRDWTWDFDLGLRAWPGRPEKSPRFFVLGRDEAGQPDGYLIYWVKDHWENERPQGTLHIEELFGLDPAAEERLWRYALEVDWISTIEAENRSAVDLLPWLLVDARLITQSNRTDLEWVRVLDPVGALEGRRYLAPGRVVLEIDDPLGHAHGRFALEGGPDGAECTTTSESADLALSVSTLSAGLPGRPSARRAGPRRSGRRAPARRTGHRRCHVPQPGRTLVPHALLSRHSPQSDGYDKVRATARPRAAMRRVPSSTSRSAISSKRHPAKRLGLVVAALLRARPGPAPGSARRGGGATARPGPGTRGCRGRWPAPRPAGRRCRSPRSPRGARPQEGWRRRRRGRRAGATAAPCGGTAAGSARSEASTTSAEPVR